MFKKLLTVGALACAMFVGSAAFAQNEEQKQAEYIHTGFWSNWSIGADAMFMYGNGWGELAEGGKLWALTHNTNFGGEILLEKEITSILSYRFAFGVHGLMRAWDEETGERVCGDPQCNFYFDRYFSILPLGVEVNLNNWFCGYKPERRWNMYAYAATGIAVLHAGPAGNVGLLTEGGIGSQWKLGKSWDTPKRNGSIVFVELAMDDYSDVPNIFNGDFHYFTAMAKVGYKYNFGITAADQEMVAQKSRLNEDYVKGLENQISALEQDLANSKQAEQRLQNRVNQLENENANLRNQLATAMANQGNAADTKAMEHIRANRENLYAMPFSIQFAINQYRVSGAERTKLKAIAEIMKSDTTAKFTVAGFCDVTGSEEYNQTLSEKRAESVKNELVNKYGVNEEQLTVKGYGKSKPFGDAKYSINRRVSFYANID